MKRIYFWFTFFLPLGFIKTEERLSWNSPEKSVNLIAPNYLPESKKENRRLAVVIDGNSKIIELSCIMSGFEGNQASTPTWKTDFQDDQISKSDDGPSWIEEGDAGWNIKINVSSEDSGDKVTSLDS